MGLILEWGKLAGVPNEHPTLRSNHRDQCLCGSCGRRFINDTEIVGEVRRTHEWGEPHASTGDHRGSLTQSPQCTPACPDRTGPAIRHGGGRRQPHAFRRANRRAGSAPTQKPPPWVRTKTPRNRYAFRETSPPVVRGTFCQKRVTRCSSVARSIVSSSSVRTSTDSLPGLHGGLRSSAQHPEPERSAYPPFREDRRFAGASFRPLARPD